MVKEDGSTQPLPMIRHTEADETQTTMFSFPQIFMGSSEYSLLDNTLMTSMPIESDAECIE